MNTASIPSSMTPSISSVSRGAHLSARLLALLCFAWLCALGAGCGDQLVEIALDGGGGSGDGGSGDGGGGSGDGGVSDPPPTVTATTPINAATERSLNQRPTATFSRMMDATTLNGATFTLRQGATTIVGSVFYANGVATFTPTLPLGVGLTYTATITTGATDPAGIALAQPYVWTFSTGACSLSSVELRSAGNFAVLAGATVTSTGATTVTGDLGVSPGSSVTGFPPGILVGALHAGDATSAIAMGDLTTAYNDAAGRTLCAITVAGDLGGRTLTPGLYKSTSSLEITSGNLTFDALGDSDAVFILQTASTLTTASASQVILAGGAKARNITWQIGSSASFGTTSAFAGTVLADQAITLATGATLDGRALARIAAVSLDANFVSTPALAP